MARRTRALVLAAPATAVALAAAVELGSGDRPGEWAGWAGFLVGWVVWWALLSLALAGILYLAAGAGAGALAVRRWRARTRRPIS